MKKVIEKLLALYRHKLANGEWARNSKVYKLPNYIFEGMVGEKASSAERRLRDLREEFRIAIAKGMTVAVDEKWLADMIHVGAYWPSRHEKNFWMFLSHFFVWLEKGRPKKYNIPVKTERRKIC
jgi:hypothetical protein